MDRVIYPVILAGGSGTRLWPISKENHPKQFLDLLEASSSLLQQSVKRAACISDIPPLVVGSLSHRFLLSKQLKELGLDESHVLLEPEGRNTASSVIAAALYVSRINPDAYVCIMPSDHFVESDVMFASAVKKLVYGLDGGEIGLVGIEPAEPSSHYGYIQIDTSCSDSGVFNALSFKEKPSPQEAVTMLEARDYFWNAGVVIGSVSALIERSQCFAAQVFVNVERAHQSMTDFFGFNLLGGEFLQSHGVSFDVAVLEKNKGIKVCVYRSEWDDLGTWQSLVSRRKKLGLTNVFQQRSVEFPLVSSELVVVSDDDILLALDVASIDTIDVAVKELQLRGRVDLLSGLQTVRPWGEFKVLSQGEGYLVKQLTVMPGCEISLQSHQFRMEHWVVISGECRVEVNEDVKLLSVGGSVSIKKEDVHRLSNVGKAPLVIVEVQIGERLNESDIVRYDDKYMRHND